MNRKVYPGVDILKFCFALCVFYMHNPAFTGPVYETYIKHIICRLAVPYFFVSTGFFVGVKYYINNRNFADVQKGTCLRLLPKLIIFELFAIAFQAAKRFLSGKSIRFILVEGIREILFYPRGALWYIQAIIVAVLLLGIVIRCHKEHLIFIIGLPLYCFLLISNRYYFLVENTALAPFIIWFNDVFITARNGLFWGFLMVGMGMLIAKYIHVFNNKKPMVIIAFVISFALYILEVCLIKDRTGLGDNSVYVMHLLLIPLLFVVSTYVNINRDTTLYRKLSVSIYLLHSPVKNALVGILETIMNIALPDWALSMVVLIVVMGISIKVFSTNNRALNNLLS